jgi:group I intron endonuclease
MREFSLIVAATLRNGIGLENKMPWDLPNDLKEFRRITQNSVVIMGRKTWESIGCRPLPKRLNIVVTSAEIPSVQCATTFLAALALADQDSRPIFVIGGSRLYECALVHPKCTTVYVTRILTDIACDTFIPSIDSKIFELVTFSEIQHENAVSYQFQKHARRHEECQYLDILREVVVNMAGEPQDEESQASVEQETESVWMDEEYPEGESLACVKQETEYAWEDEELQEGASLDCVEQETDFAWEDEELQEGASLDCVEQETDFASTDEELQESESLNCVVYTITNTKNGKTYYGSSGKVKKRWATHKRTLENGTHHNLLLQRSWNKYGVDAFEFKIIAQFSIISEALKMEEKLLEEHFQTKLCFNLSKAAAGGDNTSKHPNNAAIREKISLAGKRRYAAMSIEDRKKLAHPGDKNGVFGKHHTEEARQKMGEARRKYNQEHGSPWTGRHHTEESRAKLSIKAQQRTGVKNSFYGRTHSEETKQKIRAVHLGKPNVACAFKVRVDGVEYASASVCATQLNMCLGTVLNRCRNPNFGGYELIDKE